MPGVLAGDAEVLNDEDRVLPPDCLLPRAHPELVPRETVTAYGYLGMAMAQLLRQLGMIVHGQELTPEQLQAAYARRDELGGEADDYARKQFEELGKSLGGSVGGADGEDVDGEVR